MGTKCNWGTFSSSSRRLLKVSVAGIKYTRKSHHWNGSGCCMARNDV